MATCIMRCCESRAEYKLRFMMSVKFQTMDNLHLRKEPNTQADILTVIPAGTYLDVTETDADFKWGKVTYNDTEGWISLSYAGL